VRGTADAGTFTDLFREAKNSLWASGLGALATTIFGLAVAWLAVRRPGPLSAGVSHIVYLGFAMPGVVVALAMVFVASPHPRLYHSLPLLVAAYAILFLPQAVGAVRASLLGVPPSMEESGRSLGRSPFGVLRAVTLPLIAPGVGAGAALVFLTAMKELAATLILSPFDFDTLATGVWSAVSEAFFARAAAPALLLILLSAVPMTFLVARAELAE
jgi:iron(III) transport system permease protein